MPRMLRPLLICYLATVGAQEPKRISLGAESGRMDAQLNRMRFVRELKDGRVVLETRDQLVAVDFGVKRVETIARMGPGPKEFRRFAQGFAIGGDSTVMCDRETTTCLLVVGAEAIGSLTSREFPALSGASVSFMYSNSRSFVSFTDATDSTTVTLIDLKTGGGVTILRMGPPVSEGGRVSAMQVESEPVALFADGWISVVRREPYRVDWRKPDGSWVRGKLIPFERIKIDEKEREAYFQNRAEERKIPLHEARKSSVPYGDYYPPFGGDPMNLHASIAAPDGRLLVHRPRRFSKSENRYDVVNRNGEIEGQLILPGRLSVLGFGPKSVYVVDIDKDGVEWLCRYPWPPI
jgi:hypothetical protein